MRLGHISAALCARAERKTKLNKVRLSMNFPYLISCLWVRRSRGERFHRVFKCNLFGVSWYVHNAAKRRLTFAGLGAKAWALARTASTSIKRHIHILKPVPYRKKVGQKSPWKGREKGKSFVVSFLKKTRARDPSAQNRPKTHFVRRVLKGDLSFHGLFKYFF